MRVLIILISLCLFICACNNHNTPITLSPELVPNTYYTDDIAVTDDGDLYGIINNNTVFIYTDHGILPFNQALGSGPGEIKHITMIKTHENKLYVYDKGNSRFAVYSPERGFTETFPVTENVNSFAIINNTLCYTIAEDYQDNDPVIHTPDSVIDAIRFDQKYKQRILIENSKNNIILGFDCFKPAIYVYDVEYELMEKITLKGKWKNTTSPSSTPILTDLAFDDNNGLIFAALRGDKYDSASEIRIINMNGTELARVILPVNNEAKTADVRIAVDQKKMILYTVDQSSIRKVDYEAIAIQNNMN